MTKENLYFLAIIPPALICEEIISIQQYIATRFQSGAALKVIPHITLKAPFRFLSDQHENVIQWFDQMSINVVPFSLELKGFAAFENPKQPVIYVKPNFNPPLFDLQKQISHNFNTAFPDLALKNTELPFKPHLTIAYRDLKPQFFEEARKEFQTKNYEATFLITDFRLMQHDGKHWDSIRSYQMQL
ncbi:2'-5' RNA ligase family protein [Dyadobacter sp. NIV53]|uniref:2'-5' RNA ligase family protein n=1 Tax=Dyadobacter sp. NIV53 TaxID=2861765 RepID=UPI001C8740A7|nr:2'-5' RNA ligase family protein [Dyadobacter sp. NIV53]